MGAGGAGNGSWRVLLVVLAAGLSLLTACTDGSSDRLVSRPVDDTLDGSPGGQGRPGPIGAERRGDPPRSRHLRCPFDTDLVTEVECGRVTMPGRGDDPDFEVEIAYARFLATGDEADRRPDPVVFLHGGPGSQVLADAVNRYESVVAPYIADRDVILYDQRGAGASSPLPSCRAADGVMLGALFTTAPFDEQVEDVADALSGCAAANFGPGEFDPTAFSTAVNVQDLVDLLWALDITEYNLHGSSYGSHLAQAVMRDAPDGVRSVVLTGVYPTDISPFHHIPATLETALDQVFAGCEADERCHHELPDPWASLDRLVAELDREPRWVTRAPGRGRYTPKNFDGTRLLNALHSLLYSREGAATIPDLLLDAEDGEMGRMRRVADAAYGTNEGLLTGLLVICADEVPFDPTVTGIPPATRLSAEAVDDAAGLLGPHVPTYCDALGVRWASGTQNDPVTWDAPTLLLAGAADPITPPDWARRLADRLPRARLVVDPRATHDAATGWCATGLLSSFVDRPDRLLDVSCLDPSAHVRVDDEAARFDVETDPITVEVSLEGMDPIEVLVPAWRSSWGDVALFRWRDLDPYDPTAITIVGPDDPTDVATLLTVEPLVSEWRDGSSDLTPAGWDRSVRIGVHAHLIRYTHRSSGLVLAVAVEIGDPDGIEAGVLAPAARSITGLS